MRPVDIVHYLKNPSSDDIEGLGLYIKKVGILFAANQVYEYAKAIIHGYENTEVFLEPMFKFNQFTISLKNSFFSLQRYEFDDFLTYSYFYSTKIGTEEYYDGDIYYDELPDVDTIKQWFISVIKEYLNECFKET
jgi:hypothetical protein